MEYPFTAYPKSSFNVGQGMAPVGVDPQGFQQAQLLGQQFGPGQNNQYVPQIGVPTTSPGPKGSAWTGSSGFFTQAPVQTGQQLQASGDVISRLRQMLAGLGDPNARYEGFEPIAQRAMSRFHSDIVPSLAEKFTAMGGSGHLGSSSFAGELGKAGTDLSEGIAALQAQYGLQNQGQQNQLLSLLLSGALQPQFENNFVSPVQGILGKAAPGLGRLGAIGLGAGVGGFFGGGPGAIAGGGLAAKAFGD